MTTYRTKKLDPRLATTEEAITIQRILDLKEQQKKSYDEIEKLFETLPTCTPLVTKVRSYKTDGTAPIELTTFIVDRPEWLVQKNVPKSFEMKAKTTKQDKEFLDIED